MRHTTVQLPATDTDDHGEPGHVRIGLHFESNMTIGSPESWHTYYIHENWVLQRDATVVSKRPDQATAFNCPNCMAPFETSDNLTCSYCGEVPATGRFDWTVIAVNLLSQEARPPTIATHTRERGTFLDTVQHPYVQSMLDGLGVDDPDVTIEGLGQRLSQVYDELNSAWSSLELVRARPYVSDNLYNYLMYWVKSYQQQGLRNIMEKATITQWVVAKVVRDKHFDAITLRLWAQGMDYTTDTAGKLVSGNKRIPRIYSEYWTFIRGAGVRGAPKVDQRCPNCAADLKINMAGSCEFCNAHVTSGEFDWVLSRIEQDEAYTG